MTRWHGVATVAFVLVAACSGEPDATAADAALGLDSRAFDDAPPAFDTNDAGGDAAVLRDASDAGERGSDAIVAYRPPYDPIFAINQKIPAGVPDDPRSAAVAGRVRTNVSLRKVSLADHGEVPPVYVVAPGDPTYAVTVGGKATNFRVPSGAVPGGGSDFPLLLLDPLHPEHGAFTELRLWQAKIDDATKTLSASGAGLFHYNNDGAILNPDGTRSFSIPFRGVGTGSGLSYLAGLVRPAEVRQGEIQHAIRFAYSACDATDTFRAPATKTDQPKGCTTTMSPADERMAMGMRLQLDAAIDCGARTVPGKAATANETRFLRMFCRALQDYGMIMLDGTVAQGIVFYLEDDTTARWSGVIGDEVSSNYGWIARDQTTPSDGLTRGATDGIPWDRLRVLTRSTF